MDKEKFRKESLKKLRSISNQKRYVIDKKINNILYTTIKQRNAKSVMLYLPLEIEVNVNPLIQQLRREGILVLVPFMEGKSFRLVKYRQPLEIKQYGVKEPKISKQFRKKRINISIVPVVGIDATMRRIGFGKGMYDRFFMKQKRWIDETIFVQRTLCLSKEIITDDYDVGADRIVVIL